MWSDTDEIYQDARIIFVDTEDIELDAGTRSAKASTSGTASSATSRT